MARRIHRVPAGASTELAAGRHALSAVATRELRSTLMVA